MTFKAQHLIRLFCVLLVGVQTAGSCVYAKVPAFVNESIYSPNKATVSTIDSNLSADIVILDGGLEQGLNLGMVCLVERDAQSIGEIIIIESRSHRSAALILNLIDDLIIQSGDVARIKTFQNS